MQQKIGIIGIGKLGLCFALNLERAGFEVLGVDLSEDYVAKINQKKLKSFEPDLEALLEKSTQFKATTELKDILTDAYQQLFILVATPSPPDGGYDHTQLEDLANDLIAFGKREQGIDLIVSCTTMPGYCDEFAAKLAPYNYSVSYNPEFIAQGTIIRDQQRPDMILIGEANAAVGERIEHIYRKMCDNVPTFCKMDRLSAEITKLSINCFLTTKISFANSIGDLCYRVGANPEKVLKAVANDSRIGGRYLSYGFGFGGPCLPRDNRALGKFAEANDYPLLIGQTTDEVNRRHLDFQESWYLAKYAALEPIVFDYVTYKKDSVILEESQQLALAVRLAKAGRKVVVKGQRIVIEELIKRYGDLMTYEEVAV